MPDYRTTPPSPPFTKEQLAVFLLKFLEDPAVVDGINGFLRQQSDALGRAADQAYGHAIAVCETISKKPIYQRGADVCVEMLRDLRKTMAEESDG